MFFVISLRLSDHKVLHNIASSSSFFSISLGFSRFFCSYFVRNKTIVKAMATIMIMIKVIITMNIDNDADDDENNDNDNGNNDNLDGYDDNDNDDDNNVR